MEPTLEIGQRVLVDRIGTTSSNRPSATSSSSTRRQGPNRRSAAPRSARRLADGQACSDSRRPRRTTSINYIKRVVAGPGDEIDISEATCSSRGPHDKQFETRRTPISATAERARDCNYPTPIKIPAGHWFMMGDNRG